MKTFSPDRLPASRWRRDMLSRTSLFSRAPQPQTPRAQASVKGLFQRSMTSLILCDDARTQRQGEVNWVSSHAWGRFSIDLDWNWLGPRELHNQNLFSELWSGEPGKFCILFQKCELTDILRLSWMQTFECIKISEMPFVELFLISPFLKHPNKPNALMDWRMWVLVRRMAS